MSVNVKETLTTERQRLYREAERMANQQAYSEAAGIKAKADALGWALGVMDAANIVADIIHEGCSMGMFGASVLLRDGTKVCLNRGEDAHNAHVWLSVQPVEKIQPARETSPPASEIAETNAAPKGAE